ncbi:MAG: hypothetical protein SFY68_02470 [Candidatus Sumerlaeia bacterium]|nr:hypothetical protein [Candidatus Sumerlaeia bacterium]
MPHKAYLLGEHSQHIAPLVQSLGITLCQPDEREVDFCICYGGDGTLLGAERVYPSVPKVPIRKRPNFQEAEPEFRSILERVVSGKASKTFLPKLEARMSGKKLVAMNDVVLHNSRVVSAVRYRVEINGMAPFAEVVGDGLVIATPFGSSAYYRAITNSIIHVGLGLAFNNSTEPVNHIVLSQDSHIRIQINRGPAVFAADNNPELWNLTDGAVIECSLCSEKAEIWEIANLLCMENLSIGDSSRRLRWMST